MVDVDQDLAGIVSILTLGVGLLALFAGVEDFWMIFVIGWVVLTPLAGMLSAEDEDADADASDADPASTATTGADEVSPKDALETLRARYARGELTEEQFERKVERLLETETVEDARDHVLEAERAAGATTERERDPDS
jgi:uncharacterized membrane protein